MFLATILNHIAGLTYTLIQLTFQSYRSSHIAQHTFTDEQTREILVLFRITLADDRYFSKTLFAASINQIVAVVRFDGVRPPVRSKHNAE